MATSAAETANDRIIVSSPPSTGSSTGSKTTLLPASHTPTSTTPLFAIPPPRKQQVETFVAVNAAGPSTNTELTSFTALPDPPSSPLSHRPSLLLLLLSLTSIGLTAGLTRAETKSNARTMGLTITSHILAIAVVLSKRWKLSVGVLVVLAAGLLNLLASDICPVTNDGACVSLRTLTVCLHFITILAWILIAGKSTKHIN